MSLFNVFDIASSALTAQSVRLNTTASNLANAESGASSPDELYKEKNPVFVSEMHNAKSNSIDSNGFSSKDHGAFGVNVKVHTISESDTPPRQRYEPGNPLADETGMVYYPNINPVQQMTNMISASRSFQSNSEVINTVKTMMNKTLSLGEE